MLFTAPSLLHSGFYFIFFRLSIFFFNILSTVTVRRPVRCEEKFISEIGLEKLSLELKTEKLDLKPELYKVKPETLSMQMNLEVST